MNVNDIVLLQNKTTTARADEPILPPPSLPNTRQQTQELSEDLRLAKQTISQLSMALANAERQVKNLEKRVNALISKTSSSHTAPPNHPVSVAVQLRPNTIPNNTKSGMAALRELMGMSSKPVVAVSQKEVTTIPSKLTIPPIMAACRSLTKATSLNTKGEYTEAETAAKEGLKLNLPYASITREELQMQLAEALRGQALNNSEKQAEVEEAARNGIALKSLNKEIQSRFHGLLAGALLSQKKYLGAEDAARKGLTQDSLNGPTVASLKQQLAEALLGQNRLTEAEKTIREGLDLNPPGGETIINALKSLLNDVLKRQEQWEETTVIAGGVSAPCSSNTSSIFLTHDAFLDKPTSQESLSTALLNSALKLIEKKKHGEAEGTIRSGLVLNSSNKYVVMKFHSLLAALLDNDKRYTEAEESIREGVATGSTNPTPAQIGMVALLHYQLSLTLNHQDRFLEAEKAARDGLALNPSNKECAAGLQEQLTFALDRQKKQKESEETLIVSGEKESKREKSDSLPTNQQPLKKRKWN